MKTIDTVVMKLDRATKGAVLYKDSVRTTGVEGQALTSLYLRKDGLPEPFPPEITVTVTVTHL